MKISYRVAAALVAAVCIQLPLQAQAGLFDDDEARRAILDIRARIDAVNARVDGKADKSTSLELAGQNEQLRQEIANLRGQIEVLTNDLANEQRRQKDFYTDLDSRLLKLEPQRMSVDGREVEVEADEQRSYDNALALFKSGDYKEAGAAFSAFLKRYPRSGFAASAHYWLGNTYYAQREYRNAISSQQTVVKNYPDHPKAPDAMLNIASCYLELKDKSNARKSLESLIARYPDSSAAQTAKERLAAVK
jgi:tol-pal system protein YbgF